jgi:preprotein translocase subunit YajC
MGLLFGQTPPQGGGSNPLMTLLFFALMFAVLYFLLIMPQQRRQKQHQKLLNALKKGDRVVTSSGIFGTIANIRDNVISLVIADGVKVDIERSHIVNKVETAAKEGE